MTQYRVEWKCLTSGTQSHGDWHNSKEFIQELVNHENQKWKDKINHWVGVK
tara:strand:+ start:200 stop:352 length:153 start_codon:yes stop_codon:yes gene_type:complete